MESADTGANKVKLNPLDTSERKICGGEVVLFRRQGCYARSYNSPPTGAALNGTATISIDASGEKLIQHRLQLFTGD